MLSSSRMSKGRAVHVSRQNLLDGGVRVTIDDANTFSGDAVNLNLKEGRPDRSGQRPRSNGSVTWGHRSKDPGRI